VYKEEACDKDGREGELIGKERERGEKEKKRKRRF
jgi:hypothetical protein